MRPAVILTLSLLACSKSAPESAPEPAPAPANGPATRAPTGEEATRFVAEVDEGFRAKWVTAAKAAWAYETNITPETEKASSEAEEASMAYTSEVIPRAAGFDGVTVAPDVRRQLELIKESATLPAPKDPAARKRFAEITTRLSGMYGKGKYCKSSQSCQDLGALDDIMAKSRDADELLDAWVGWRTVSPPMRADYQAMVDLGNTGASEIGYADMADLWRSKYDMSPAAFEAEIDRLYTQVKPLYEQLHCHVRAKLAEKYGDVVPTDGLIPAHLTGNMWAQSWENIYPLVEPYPGEASLDVSDRLNKPDFDPKSMVRQGEAFFTSMGLDPMPATFWERSMFSKPKDREVVCHASAWDVGMNDDQRVKMCIRPTTEDFTTVHHELGHNYYNHYYYQLPVVLQQGAHDGFHEAVGDALVLSITPSYLKEIGLLDTVSENEKSLLNKQMADALARVAFLPFGRMIDQWRWDVFAGKIPPDKYNEAWWRLRAQYQGIGAPVARTEDNFDPGAKYHIPANTPYIRYFLAHILQFQFHKGMCEAAGHTGPLHTCSVYGSKEAGERLIKMLAMGASRPWPDALEVIAGTRQMDAAALLAYFEPLSAYLKEQNQGRTCGW